ncbi:hypothetical protein [Aneurinibacillus tyrosinisolvens]|uniref:hypothetical protein n=1 Tax=Aneurinibacillus tyrosinisolvens TaxID=1443435 RepID=UPI00063EF4B1|nr:hypothetical protein [Aneurinibacillus tyrosinisolvens]
MNRYIEGTFFKASNDSPMIYINETSVVLLMNGEVVRVNFDGEWISGIHIGGDIINYGGKAKLRIGDRIRIKNAYYKAFSNNI